MITIVGAIADWIGAAAHVVAVPYGGPERTFDVKHEFTSTPSTEYRSVQAAAINVDVNHDRRIGELKYLERNEQRLYAVAEIDGSSLDEGPWFFSPHIRHHDGRDIELLGLAVTRNPASVGLRQIDAFPFPLNEAAGSIVYQHGHPGALAKRACEYDRRRKPDDPIIVQDEDASSSAVHADEAFDVALRQAGPVEIRSSATTLGVSFAKRVLELIVMPFETPALVAHNGRMVTEVVSRGAFDTIARDGGKVRVNRDHDRQRTIGRAIAFHPHRHEGLVAELRISKTDLGEETLALADDGVLDASAGFAVLPGGERWETRSRRRLTKLHLDHVALVPDPAYAGANVLAVRGWPARSATPNLDKVREPLLADISVR